MFKDYIKPEWEDIKNKDGGRWVYDIAWDKSKHEFISQYTENVWTKLILSLIGNLFEETEYFVNIIEGGGLYGYAGIKAFIKLMEDAFIVPKDTEDIIPRKGLGCACVI